MSVEEVEGSKHILCAYVSGPESIVMEQCSDEEVAEGIHTKNLKEGFLIFFWLILQE